MAKNCCQKKPKNLGTKAVQFWCYTKLTKTKNVLLHWYYLTKKTFKWFLTLKIDFENQILALFDLYFWSFNKSQEKKIYTVFVISAIMASIWNVFIKFPWYDEKLTDDFNSVCTLQLIFFPYPSLLRLYVFYNVLWRFSTIPSGLY